MAAPARHRRANFGAPPAMVAPRAGAPKAPAAATARRRPFRRSSHEDRGLTGSSADRGAHGAVLIIARVIRGGFRARWKACPRRDWRVTLSGCRPCFALRSGRLVMQLRCVCVGLHEVRLNRERCSAGAFRGIGVPIPHNMTRHCVRDALDCAYLLEKLY